jgi:hypothetical protein
MTFSLSVDRRSCIEAMAPSKESRKGVSLSWLHKIRKYEILGNMFCIWKTGGTACTDFWVPVSQWGKRLWLNCRHAREPDSRVKEGYL